ncbi:MAG: hypothetical protein ACR2NY_06105 [Alphaproteobacteria bacterium]
MKKHKHHFGLINLGSCYLSIDERRQYHLPYKARGFSLWVAAGQNYWQYFLQNHHRASRRYHHPFDNWSRIAMKKIGHTMGVKTSAMVFPYHKGRDNKPLPFQNISKKFGFSASPLGLFIHPTFGLWAGFRGGFIHQKLPPYRSRWSGIASPCAACLTKPCIAICPAKAVHENYFDTTTCHDYLHHHRDAACLTGGCLARLACPIGTKYRYHKNQSQFFWRGLGW